MIKVMKVERNDNTTWVHLEVPQNMPYSTVMGIMDGHIEAYQGTFGLEDPTDAVLLLMIDSYVEDVDSFAPNPGDPNAAAAVRGMIRKYAKEVDWNDLRNDVLNACTQDEETAEFLKKTWAAELQHQLNNPANEESPIELAKKAAEAQQRIAEGYARQQEDRLADEFVGELPREVRAMPREAPAPAPNGDDQIRFVVSFTE